MTGADIIPFDRSEPSKGEYMEAIQTWCRTMDVAETLSKAEIGAMGWNDRMDAQRKAMIWGFSKYLRKHMRSDVALGVYLLTTLLSDNDRGHATISQATLGKLLGRSVSSIADAQKRLRDEGLIVTERGRYAGSYPVIPRAVTQTRNHMVWMVEAICANETVNHLAGPDDCQSSGRTPSLNQSTGPAGGLKQLNHSVESVSIIRPDPGQIQLRNSEENIPLGARERSTTIGRAAAAIAAGIASTVLPAAAAPVEPPAQVEITKPECWETPKARMDAGMNVHELRAQRQVWQTGTGLLEVAGEFKDELERMFPLVDLPQGLAIAAATVHISQGALKAMQEIRKRFAYQQSDMAAKQKRAEAYGKRDGSPRAGGSRPFLTPDEQQRERNRRFLDSLDLPTTMPRPADEAY